MKTALEILIENIDLQLTNKFCPVDSSGLKMAKQLAIDLLPTEKQKIIDELKLIGNYFDVSKLDVYEHKYHVRFTNIIQDRINQIKNNK